MALRSVAVIQLTQTRWELRDVLQMYSCFSSTHMPSEKAIAAGTREACYEAAKLLGCHIDIIMPRKDL